MAQPSQFASELIDETVQTFNGDVTAISPTDGVSLIDNWISALHSGDESTNPIAHTLSELRMELQGGMNTGQIQSTIQELADQTKAASQGVDGPEQESLAQLASALQTFGQQLANGGSQSNQSRQSDMDDPTGSTGGIGSNTTTGAYSSDNSDMSGAPFTGSSSVGGDTYNAAGTSQTGSGMYGSGAENGNTN
ncbi:hypothetical protein J2I47_14290 [Fibrella sp. HMF5335]|uniref:Uncharacterized protein n=1 Tax=Fibrella rubiginis TaxID=2817060 RepID=A0A939GI98_9BACT|nr:hypothetical protein [Fibrella rubiginis]MBO0937724.1 hypothetical protein [Fibrella rubiginis]